MAKKASKILLRVLIVLLLLFGSLAIAIRIPAFQTFLAHRAAAFFSYKLNTKVSIEKVELSFFNKAEFVNFYMEDLNGDTLVATERLLIKVKVFELLDKQVSISSIQLDRATLHLKRDSAGLTNVGQLFGSTYSSAGDTTPKPKQPFTWKIELNELTLTNTDFQYYDVKGNLDL
ncbi:MAG: AsmA family protein, partial [Bacteroidetes bacterium]|nr:AsmA family protein [Bacteroidota bacterium]